MNESQAAAARNKRFGAESRVPLAPGDYQLVATLTNDLNHQAVRQRTEITVPDPAQTTFGAEQGHDLFATTSGARPGWHASLQCLRVALCSQGSSADVVTSR